MFTSAWKIKRNRLKLRGESKLVGANARNHLIGSKKNDELLAGYGGDILDGRAGVGTLIGWTRCSLFCNQ